MANPASRPVKKQNPWVSIMCGVVIAFLGYCFYHYCDGLEKGTRDPQSVPRLFALLYQLGGKWFAAGVIMLLGGLAVFSGIRDLSRKQGSREDPASASLE
jgi:hypothetical protein